MSNSGMGNLVPVLSYALDDAEEDEATKRNKDPGKRTSRIRDRME